MTQTDSSTFSSTMGSTAVAKYDGLLEIPFYKILSQSIVALYSYIDNIVPSMPALYYVVTFFRLMQLIGPALFVPFMKIWVTGTAIQRTLSYLSVLFHILPFEYRSAYAEWIEWGYVAIALAGLIFIVASAWYYKKTAKLPKFICYCVYIYTVSLGFLIHPIQGFYVGGILTRVITGTYEPNAYYLSLIIVSFIIMLTYIWFIKQYYCLSLLFRGCSLQTLDEYGQMIMIFTTMFVTFLIAATLMLDNQSLIIVCVIAVIFYLSNIHLLYTHQTFLKSGECKLFLTTSITGAIFTIVAMIVVNLGKTLNEIALFVMICIYIAVYFFVSLLVKLKDRKYLMLLDEFDETKEITWSHWRFGPASITGIQYGHAVFVDLSIFKAATDKWPTSTTVWVTYAKLCAVYPEYQNNLHIIEQAMVANKVKGGAKKIVSQIRSLSKTRETNLSPDLKSKLSHFSKSANKAKQRLRNIWDLILQGNTAEMENSIAAAYQSVGSAQQQLEHIRMQYPNNRFVARQYYRFLIEVLADQENSKIWKENVTSLQRGNPICPDVAQTLGTASLPTFPTKVFVDQSTNFATTLEIGDTSEDILTEVDQTDESTNIIDTLIKQHKVPAVTCMQVTSVVLFFIVVLLPSVVLMALFLNYTNSVTDPLSHLYGIAFTRHLVGVIPAFVMRYMEEQVEDPELPGEPYAPAIDTSQYGMESFGGEHTVAGQLHYLMTEVVDSSSLLGPIRSYAMDSEKMDQVRALLFNPNLEYRYYTTAWNYSSENAIVETLLSRVSDQAAKVLQMETITKTEMVGPAKLTAINNFEDATSTMDSALEILMDYLKDVVKTNKTTYTIVAIVLSILICLIYVIAYICQISLFNRHKREVFRCLTYLPKTVISNVSASYYQLKKDNGQSSSSLDSDSEINKQEENAIKVFSSISDERSTSTASLLYLLTNVIVVALAVIVTVYISLRYIGISDTIQRDAPHIDKILGTCSSMYRGFIYLQQIVEETDGFKGVTHDINAEVSNLLSALNNMCNFFVGANFGTQGNDEYPYSQIAEASNSADQEISCDPTTPPASITENLNCFNPRMRVFLLNSVVYKRISAVDFGVYPQARGDSISSLWTIGPVLMYDSFFYPMIESLLTTMTQQVNSDFDKVLACGVVCIVLAFIFTMILLVEASSMQTLLIFTLEQLLHCPPSAVLASTKIMKILSGNYKVDLDDTTERKSSFFAEVVNQLTDLVIVLKKEDQTIISTNAAFNKAFNVTQEELVGQPMTFFFSSDRFDGKVDDIFQQPTTLVYKEKGEKRYILFQSALSNNSYIITGRDKSRQVAHEQLISDERKKSDALLSSILPPSMVPRVQAGEKEISFAVQSISVLFLDIVSFTPWCGSHDAAYVMKTLNLIFKELDAAVATHKTLTKIKCIGDCYMAASGIFDEVNNPPQHAKEMVEFGCEAINIVLDIDDRLNEKLQIRVGINTGGPIVAGVLGIESKPTFEILGPTINIAQQMEHHGVPMLVHISRPVYELIYGGSFNIKERGEVEVKNGKMFTYLVTPPPRQTN